MASLQGHSSGMLLKPRQPDRDGLHLFISHRDGYSAVSLYAVPLPVKQEKDML